MDGFEMAATHTSLDQLLPSTLSLLAVFLIHVTHALGADIERQADGVLGVLHVAATLHDVLGEQVKGDRAVDLLEEAREEAEVIVLPLDLAGDLVHELGVRQVAASLGQRALVTALQKRVIVVVEEATPGETCLLSVLGSEDVKDEDVSGYFLVLFDLDDVARLKTAPV